MKEFDYESIPAGYYDQIYHQRRGPQSKWHHLKFEFFEMHIGSSDRVLDIGCGPGTFLGNLKSYRKGVGVDISDSQVNYANTQYGGPRCSFHTFDGNRLPFPDESFDVVTLVEVIEHISSKTFESLLSEAHRLLRAGGRIYISTPNYGSLWPLLELAVNCVSEVTYEAQHINKFKRKRLKRELEESNFTEVNVRAYQFIAPFLAVLTWTFADKLSSVDRGILSSRIGFLLFAKGIKNCPASGMSERNGGKMVKGEQR